MKTYLLVLFFLTAFNYVYFQNKMWGYSEPIQKGVDTSDLQTESVEEEEDYDVQTGSVHKVEEYSNIHTESVFKGEPSDIRTGSVYEEGTSNIKTKSGHTEEENIDIQTGSGHKVDETCDIQTQSVHKEEETSNLHTESGHREEDNDIHTELVFKEEVDYDIQTGSVHKEEDTTPDLVKAEPKLEPEDEYLLYPNLLLSSEYTNQPRPKGTGVYKVPVFPSGHGGGGKFYRRRI